MNNNQAASPVQTQLISHSGLSFTVDTVGPKDGAPVLLLHGFPQSRHAWREQLPVLGQAGFRAYAPDQRGYSSGARPDGTEPYGLDQLISDALALMDTVAAPRFHVIGHDWGGHLAWTLALRAPQRMLSLAVLSRPHPAAFVMALKGDPEQAARSGHHSSLLQPGVAAAMRASDFSAFRAMYKHQRVPDDAAEHYLDILRQPGAIEAAIEWYRAGASTFRNASAGQVKIPTLYIWGNADATVGRLAAESSAQFVDGPFRFVEIPDAGHFLTDEVPQRISELLIEHLRSFSKL